MDRSIVAAAEERRCKVARLGGECALTRAGGIHMVGGSVSEHGKRKMDGRWEAGDKCHTTLSRGSPAYSKNGVRGPPFEKAPQLYGLRPGHARTPAEQSAA